jgi:hypothetical protein
MDEALAGFTAVVSRLPESGRRVSDTNVWAWQVRLPDAEFMIYYTFDEDRAVLQSIVPGFSDRGD